VASNKNIQYRATAVLNDNVQLFGGYNTRSPLFGQSSSGVSYNVTLNGGDGTIDACGFTPYLDLSSTYWSSLVYVMTVVVAHGRRQTFAYRKSCPDLAMSTLRVRL